MSMNASRLPAWETDASAEHRLLAVMNATRRPMTQDELTAAIALWMRIATLDALLGLLMDGRITAAFTGDTTADAHDLDRYTFTVLTDETLP